MGAKWGGGTFRKTNICGHDIVFIINIYGEYKQTRLYFKKNELPCSGLAYHSASRRRHGRSGRRGTSSQ